MKSGQTWVDLGRAMKDRKLYTPPELRTCRLCDNGRNSDRLHDGCYPHYICKLEEMAGQRGLPGMSPLREHPHDHTCPSWTPKDE